MGAHGFFLQLQEQSPVTADALKAARPQDAPLDTSERELLDFVRVLTLAPADTTDQAVEQLRTVGWTDPQIAEAAYITALFAFFNRVADAFGLEDPNYGDMAQAEASRSRKSEHSGDATASPPGLAPVD